MAKKQVKTFTPLQRHLLGPTLSELSSHDEPLGMLLEMADNATCWNPVPYLALADWVEENCPHPSYVRTVRACRHVAEFLKTPRPVIATPVGRYTWLKGFQNATDSFNPDWHSAPVLPPRSLAVSPPTIVYRLGANGEKGHCGWVSRWQTVKVSAFGHPFVMVRRTSQGDNERLTYLQPLFLLRVCISERVKL